MLYLSFVGRPIFGNLSVHVSRQAFVPTNYLKLYSTDKILKEIALLVCKNSIKIQKMYPLARINIDSLYHSKLLQKYSCGNFVSSSSSSSSYNLQRALEPIAKMNLCVCLARTPMKATDLAN